MSNWTPRIGMKVQCVRNATTRGGWGWEQVPAVGDVLTIRTVEYRAYPGTLFRFDEIHNPPAYYDVGLGEFQFWASRFRPLEEISASEDLAREEVKREGDGKQEVVPQHQQA